MVMLPPISDNEIYSLIPSERLYRLCDVCKCVICFYRYDCRLCYFCEFQPYPIYYCSSFELKVFSREPYKTYISEVDTICGYKPPKKYI